MTPSQAGAPHARPGLLLLAVSAAVVLLLAETGAVLQLAAARADRAWAISVTGGDPARAPALMIDHGCAGCHEIAGVAGANGRVGPALSGLAERIYIAGRL